MRYLRVFSALIIFAFAVGCTMPATTVKTVDERPSLAFKNAPSGALLYLDGLNMGDAAAYDGAPRVLLVEPGTHVVRIVQNGAVIYEQKVFLESSLKTITINQGMK